ncbi:hypothetical protein GY45DRAFT_1355205 [Cubamyces sp. BRFM 1775]|nr:hypothetical protein GY45DRAFT_1355205 [Cubamyces sp. BRFM 1775]
MLSARPISFNGDIDVATQPILNAKTPGRKALKNRAALQENAVHSGAKTVLSKKNVLQTPFRPGTTHGKKPLVSVSVTRPLMDKTPFPNRVAPGGGFGTSKTPGGKGSKLSKLSLLVPEPEQPELLSPDVAPLLRPSSTRKSLRGRLSGTFKTPMTKGDYWNVSPGDMEMEMAGGTAEQVMAVDDEDDEIEYMPPTAIERPYEPPFELPDYKSMGSTLFNLGHTPLLDDTLDMYYSKDIEEQVNVRELIEGGGNPSSIEKLDLPELEDDSPFARKPAKPAATAPVTQPRAGPSRAVSISAAAAATRTQPTARPATAIPQSRSSSRTTTTSSGSGAGSGPTPNPNPGPAPTRTSVLRAAKAAAASSSNSATTPHPTRPTSTAASAGARPASAIPQRRVVSATATTKPVSRQPAAAAVPASKSTTTGTAATSLRARAATTTAATGTRARSATVTASSAKGNAANAAGPPKAPGLDDALAQTLEKEIGGGLDDFQFEL